MTLPTKAKQIEAVMKFLDSDATEGRELRDIAADIVEGYLDALTSGIKTPMQPIRLGMWFRTPEVASKNHRVLWMNEEKFWYAAETSSFGGWGFVGGSFWECCEEFVPRDVEKTAAGWENPAYSVGEVFSQFQRTSSFEAVATGPKCVLLRDVKSGQLMADSNANLEKYYRREIEEEKVGW